ncbi:MAG: hypothetical protein RLZZ241_455 [Bacteroidota bacterium]
MMLIALATGVGLRHKIREKVSAFNGHIQIFNYDTNASQVSVVPVSKNQEFYPDFKMVSGVKHIQVVATKAGIIRTADTFEGILVKGVDKDYDWTAFKDFLQAGAFPDFSGPPGPEALISKTLANRLNLEVGSFFDTYFLKDEDPSKIPNRRRFKVSGIYDSGFEEFDSSYVFIDLQHIQRMNNWAEDEVGAFEVFLEQFDQIEEKNAEIYSKTSSNLDTQTISGKFAPIFEWIGLFDFNIALIIGIMILVGGINMITALLVLILERTPMIGILKAIGAQDWSIRKVFLYNAAYLIGIGLLWGNVLGLGLLALQQRYRFLKFPNPEEYYMDYIPVYIDGPTVVMLNVGVLLLCLLMLLLPSFIVTRISPVKAIKFE